MKIKCNYSGTLNIFLLKRLGKCVNVLILIEMSEQKKTDQLNIKGKIENEFII